MAAKKSQPKKAAPKAGTPPDEPRKPHLIGYARVSMSDQTNRRQIDALTAYGVAEADIWTDMASGKNMQRPGWEACWKDLRGPEGDQPGDTLVVHSIDRLGRDPVEVISTVKALHDRGCELKVLAMDIDTRTATGRLLFAIIAAMAQWERELSLERTRHGLAVAKAEGRVGGRVSKVTDDMIREAAKLGTAAGARKVGLGKVQFIRRKQRLGIENGD